MILAQQRLVKSRQLNFLPFAVFSFYGLASWSWRVAVLCSKGRAAIADDLPSFWGHFRLVLKLQARLTTFSPDPCLLKNYLPLVSNFFSGCINFLSSHPTGERLHFIKGVTPMFYSCLYLMLGRRAWLVLLHPPPSIQPLRSCSVATGRLIKGQQAKHSIWIQSGGATLAISRTKTNPAIEPTVTNVPKNSFGSHESRLAPRAWSWESIQGVGGCSLLSSIMPFFLLKKNLNPFQEQHWTAAVSYTRHTSDRTAAAQEDARSNCVLLPFENTNAIWRFPPPRWLGMSGERSDRKSGARPDLRPAIKQ